MVSKSEDSDLESVFEEEVKSTSESARPAIERFYSQIHSFPKLIGKADVIDKTLLRHFQEIRHSAVEVIDQLQLEKQTILKKFDSWLMPLAKEVLDDLLKDADALKTDLDESLEKLDSSIHKDWIEYAKKWAQLYAKWHDRKGITRKVIKLAEARTAHLIEKDIKIIKEYQEQRLSHVPKESDEFFNLERRLIKATADPLRNLVALKKPPSTKEGLSIKQASDWIANFHKKRESFFDMVLVKIDAAAKDLVASTAIDQDLFNELQGEIKFIEHEIDQINPIIPHLQRIDKDELKFLNERVSCLIDHLEDYDLANLPKELQQRLDKIQQWITVTSAKIAPLI